MTVRRRGSAKPNPFRAVVLVLACALAGAAPPMHVPNDAQTTVVRSYLDSIEHGAYASAFRALKKSEQQYFRDDANLASVFRADSVRLLQYRIVDTRSTPSQRVYIVRERLQFRDHAANVDRTADATALYGVVREGSTYRLRDPGHPWRAFDPEATENADGVRLSVRKISFFPRRIEVVITFANVADGFVTFLPYGRTVLKDDRGTVYRPLATRDWRLTSRALFEGLRLAPNAQYTAPINFESPVLDNAPRTFTLTVAPALRDGSDAPFSTTIANIAPEK